MSSHDPLPEETELQALFDATADEPSADHLHRLARHAAQIPERATVSPVTRWLRRLVPALALAASAAAGWWLLAPPDTTDPGPGPVATQPAIALGDDDGGDAIKPDSSVIPLLDEEQEAMALAVLDGDLDDEDEEDLGGSLDLPLASLDVAGGAISHPMDAAELLFGDDDDLLDLDAVFDEEGG